MKYPESSSEKGNLIANVCLDKADEAHPTEITSRLSEALIIIHNYICT